MGSYDDPSLGAYVWKVYSCKTPSRWVTEVTTSGFTHVARNVSDDGGWGITWSSDKPVAPDRPFPLCTPCGPGPSQVSSSDFSTQLTGSVGSGGSGWGVTFQHTPVGQSDVATARSRSPRSFSNSTPFERDVEANLLCGILDVVRSEEKEGSPLETEEGEDFDGLLAADEEAADLKARSRGADND